MRSTFTTVLEGLARINVIRRFSAQKASDQGKVEAYLQRELVKIRDSFRELPDRSQQLEEGALDRVLYPIVALADVYAGDIMMVEGTSVEPPAPTAPKRAPPPPTRVPPPAPAAVAAPQTVQGPPSLTPPRVTPAPAPVDSPVIPEARKGAFEWASILELQEYGTNIAGQRVPDNVDLILRDELPKLGRIIQGQRHDQPARPINERDEKVEAYAYWFVLRLGFMDADQAEPLARRLRKRFADYKSAPSLTPPPTEKSSKTSSELVAWQALAPAFVVLAGMLCMYLLHVDQRNSARAFERVIQSPEQR